MTKVVYIERVEDLESELAQLHEELQEAEAQALQKLADAELAAAEVRRERDQLYEQAQQVRKVALGDGGGGWERDGVWWAWDGDRNGYMPDSAGMEGFNVDVGILLYLKGW